MVDAGAVVGCGDAGAAVVGPGGEGSIVVVGVAPT
jgi:hypothetical protein